MREWRATAMLLRGPEGKTSMMQDAAKGVAALSGTDVLVSGPIVLGGGGLEGTRIPCLRHVSAFYGDRAPARRGAWHDLVDRRRWFLSNQANALDCGFARGSDCQLKQWISVDLLANLLAKLRLSAQVNLYNYLRIK